MAIDKYNLNLVGEYRAAAELLKRGLFATITYGNKKGADVFAIGKNRRAAVIEVKAATGKKFVTSFYQKYADQEQPHPDFWVLYSLKELGDRFDEAFYVLTHDELAMVQAVRNRASPDSNYAQIAAMSARGVDGVYAPDVESCQDAWWKIMNYCNSEP